MILSGIDHFQVLMDDAQLREFDAEVERTSHKKSKVEELVEKENTMQPQYNVGSLIEDVEEEGEFSNELKGMIKKYDRKEIGIVQRLYRDHFPKKD